MPFLIRPNYGTRFEVFVALIRAARIPLKKNPAGRLFGEVRAESTITGDYVRPLRCPRSIRRRQPQPGWQPQESRRGFDV
jgi:hypothetical protein